MRVLVVDDDNVTCEILVEDLRQFGYDVTAATNGREAFELVRTGQFHLIVSDWQMPEMSGLDLCREIRKRQWSGYIYVILLTSRTGADNVVCGLNAGADDFLSKPFHPQELRMRLRTGERILSLESRDLMIFAMAKLAESIIQTDELLEAPSQAGNVAPRPPLRRPPPLDLPIDE